MGGIRHLGGDVRSLLTSPFARGFAGAIVAAVVVLLAIHAWSDHAALHIVVDFLNRHADKINTLP